MTDKKDEPELSPEEFISGLDDEQLELVRLDYFNRLAAAASEAAAILGPTVVAECHEAVGAELLLSNFGRDFFREHLEGLHAQIESLEPYRFVRR